MKRFLQLGLVSCAMIAVVGCTTKNYAAAVDSWRGAPVHALINHWGRPDEVKTLSKGKHVYIYRTVEHESIPKAYMGSPSLGRMSPQTDTSALSRVPRVMRHHENFWCETMFETNPTGMIVNTTFSGNNCVFTKDDAKHWAFSSR